MGDITFPGIVMLLKLLSKLFVERQVGWMDTAKALVVLPIDIVFLALSFGAAILYATPVENIKTGNIKNMFVFVLACVAIALTVTMLSRKGDLALDGKKFFRVMFFTLVAYFASIYTLLQSFKVEQFFK